MQILEQAKSIVRERRMKFLERKCLQLNAQNVVLRSRDKIATLLKDPVVGPMLVIGALAIATDLLHLIVKRVERRLEWGTRSERCSSSVAESSLVTL
jgi:hypothetical protein